VSGIERRRAVHRGAYLTLGLGLLLAACSPSSTDVVANETSATSDAPPPDTAEDGSSEHGPHGATTEPCDEATDAAVDATLTAQLAAFAADDYAEALTYASRDFQRDFDVERFRSLITTDFADLADSTDHLVLRCDRVAVDLARVDVVVTSTDGRTSPLTYLFVEEDGRWAVAAAANLPDASLST
jgi:hypothetical protein